MASRYTIPLYRIIMMLAIVAIAKAANAQLYASSPYHMSKADSSTIKITEKAFSTTIFNKPIAENALVKESNYQERKRLLGYLKTLNVAEDQQLQPNKKFYYHLANVFARLRLYPLAMKCFLKTAQTMQDENILQQPGTDSTLLDTAALQVNLKDDSVINQQAIPGRALSHSLKSKRISYAKILAGFNDGKPAAGYALLFHVKQPVPGKRKIFVWGNTGHTFITLIKYNKDSTYVSASFGFYPHKDQLLSATPLFPTTASTFKDDTGHEWDEVVGKFISKHRFEKLLKLTKDYDGLKYNLNNRNCTDFGLQAASVAGIIISNTWGTWPLGNGNNPALTGQSLLMGTVADEDFKGNALFKASLVK